MDQASQQLTAKSFGIDTLSPEEQERILAQIQDVTHERLLLYIVMRLAPEMRENFAEMCETQPDEVLFEWAQQHVQDIDVLIEETINEVRKEFTFSE